MEVDDEEVPPLLVDTETFEEELENSVKVRVPITIVTGMLILQCIGFYG
jgi:hypothetical protein